MHDNLQRTFVQSIIDYLPCGLSVFDADLRLVAWNWKFRTLLDLPDSLFAQPVITYEDLARNNAQRGEYGPGDVEAIVARKVEEARHPKDMLFERVRHDGKPIEVRSGPMPGGGFVTTYMDISERKRAERMKTEFVSAITHELRTPMTSIMGSLSMLKDGMAGPLPPDAGKLIDLSTASSQRLLRLIDDLLDMERLEAKVMSFHLIRQPLGVAVEQAVAATRAYAQQLQVGLACELPAHDALVRFDFDRIVQVVVNLVSNAAKFAPQGSTVQVGLNRRDGIWRVSVTDTGSGIPEEFRDRIFERFSQADGSNQRKIQGTGLGLHIARSIVQAHDGQIGFMSEPHVRTEFWFDLPAAD